jgi:hypothetical protein
LEKHTQIQQFIHQPDLIIDQKYFEPNKHHPFYEEICKAQIPLDKNQPSLLLHDLPPYVPSSLLEMFEKGKRKRNDSGDVDIEGTSDSDEERETDDDMKVAQHIHPAARSILEKSARMFSDGKIGTLNCFHFEYIIGNSLILIGVSGCSKTRTIYEALCCRYLIQCSFLMNLRMGLYFTCSVGGNGGSNDMETMISNIQVKLLPFC